MLSVPTTVLDALHSDEAEVGVAVSIGAPVSADVSRLVLEPPVVTTSFRPGKRVIEASSATVTVANAPDSAGRRPFDEWETTSLLYGKRWHKAQVAVSLKVAGTTFQVASMFLSDVVVNHETDTARLVCTDRFQTYRRSRVDAAKVGTTIERITPAALLRDHLLDATATPLDSASFAAYELEENLEDFVVRWTFADEDSASAVQRVLEWANAGLRWNASGQLEYFKLRPQRAVSVFQLHVARNLAALEVSRPGESIINEVRVERDDGSGGTVETANSPVKDTDSQADYGVVNQLLTTHFRGDFPAEQAAGQRVYFYSQPVRRITATCTLGAVAVEPGDVVAVTDSEYGLVDHLATVYTKTLDVARRTVKLDMLSSILTNESWLYLDNGQNLDTGQKVW